MLSAWGLDQDPEFPGVEIAADRAGTRRTRRLHLLEGEKDADAFVPTRSRKSDGCRASFGAIPPSTSYEAAGIYGAGTGNRSRQRTV